MKRKSFELFEFVYQSIYNIILHELLICLIAALHVLPNVAMHVTMSSLLILSSDEQSSISMESTPSNVPLSSVDENCSPLLVEQICIMLEQEVNRYSINDYLTITLGTQITNHHPIDEPWRQKSAEWMFKVVDYYDLDRDIVNIGMTYLDRMFAETSLHHHWTKLQCKRVAMASLKLAIKLNEPRTLNMEDMIKLGMGGTVVLSVDDLVEMENEILWKVSACLLA